MDRPLPVPEPVRVECPAEPIRFVWKHNATIEIVQTPEGPREVFANLPSRWLLDVDGIGWLYGPEDSDPTNPESVITCDRTLCTLADRDLTLRPLDELPDPPRRTWRLSAGTENEDEERPWSTSQTFTCPQQE